MAIREHPKKGSILLCDFSEGFKRPEMIKKRPVIVLSPKIKARPNLCTVVSLSTTAPNPIMPYHAQIDIFPPLPEYYASNNLWIKGDMVNAVGFHRLHLIGTGRGSNNQRIYYYDSLSPQQMEVVIHCVLRAMGLSFLTKHV